MLIIVYIICFLIFIVWLAYEHRKSGKLERKATQSFWEREQEANQTRKKDISSLPLIHIDEDELPLVDTGDDTVTYYIGQIRSIIKEPMMDLSEYSNTDLKLAYGVGNFKTLSDYDENFNSFLINLSNLARSYEKSGSYQEAAATYQCALHYGSQKLSDYKELAQIYLKIDQPANISALIETVSEGNIPHHESVIENLRCILASYQ